MKKYILLIVLIILTIPSLSGSIIKINIGAEVDFNLFQILCFGIVFSWLVVKHRIPTNNIIKSSYVILSFLVILNLVRSQYDIPIRQIYYYRGIFAFINIAVIITGIYIYITRVFTPKMTIWAISYLCIIVAFSAIFEFALLKIHSGAHEIFRTLIFPKGIDALAAGGASFSIERTRVAGIVGAPDAIGVYLSFSIPFILLFNQNLKIKISILALFAIAGMLSGSRLSLIFILATILYLVLFSNILTSNRVIKGIYLIVAMVVVVLLVSIGPNMETLISRFSVEDLIDKQWRFRVGNLFQIIKFLLSSNERLILGAGLAPLINETYPLSYWTYPNYISSGALLGDFSIIPFYGGIIGLIIIIIVFLSMFRQLKISKNCTNFFRVAMVIFVLCSVFRTMYAVHFSKLLLRYTFQEYLQFILFFNFMAFYPMYLKTSKSKHLN